MKKLVSQFKIRFSKDDKTYAKVFIFPNLDTMWKFYGNQRAKFGEYGSDDFKAMFQPFEIYKFKGKKETKSNWIGNFLFWYDGIGSGVVAHEAGHAALHWFEIQTGKKQIKNLKQEERFLWTLGYLVAQFWTEYYKIKKVKET